MVFDINVHMTCWGLFAAQKPNNTIKNMVIYIADNNHDIF